MNGCNAKRRLKRSAEAVRQRQRKMQTAMRDICLRNAKGSNLYIAHFCPLLYTDSKPIIRVDDAAYEINFVIPGIAQGGSNHFRLRQRQRTAYHWPYYK